jgi:hypothetical protein
VTIFRIRRSARNSTGLPDDQGAIVYRVITPPAGIIAHEQ